MGAASNCAHDSAATLTEPAKRVTGVATSAALPVAAVWTSPYHAESSSIPLPTRAQVRAVIPSACFERSYYWSLFYLARDLATAGSFWYSCSLVLSTEFPAAGAVDAALWLLGWSLYAVGMGTILAGLWVLAHECGHGAFSDSFALNCTIGFVVHQSLLVPYFAWQYTHAKHHRRTNHLSDGETHVPNTAAESGIVNQLPVSDEAAIHHLLGDEAFCVVRICIYLLLGWPLYLLGVEATGKLKRDGTPAAGALMDHFRPHSHVFPDKLRPKIILSTLTLIATLAALCYAKYVYGPMPVLLYYWAPYVVTNAWLVIYTLLHHTDPSVPHYGDDEWTWVRGAISTIDRDYGLVLEYLHHGIGSTHVMHHFFPEVPWYHAATATTALRAYLEPLSLYNYDPTPWYCQLLRMAHTCHYVQDNTGIQYWKSFDNLARSNKKVL